MDESHLILSALEAQNVAAHLRLDLAQTRRALDATTIAHNRMRAALVEAQQILAPVRNVIVERALKVIKEGLGEEQT